MTIETETPTSTPITISTPTTGHLAQPHQSLMQEARDLSVTDAESHGRGLEIIKRAQLAHRAVEDLFREPKAAAHKAHNFLTEMEKALLSAPDSAKAEAMTKVTEYEEVERRRAEEEARRKEEEARKAEEERLIADAQAAERDGRPEDAEAILSEPVSAPIIAPAPKVAQLAGVSSVTRYAAQVVSMVELVKYVAAHPEYINLLTPNTTALNQLARAQREALKIPGVKVAKEISKSVRSA